LGVPADQAKAQHLADVLETRLAHPRREPAHDLKDAEVALFLQLLDLGKAQSEGVGAIGPVEFYSRVPHHAEAGTQLSSPVDINVTAEVAFWLRSPVTSKLVQWNAPAQ